MSDTRVVEAALIGVELVVLTDSDNRKYTFSTATEANAKVKIKEGESVELVIKNVLKGARQYDDVILGVDIEFKDNMFLPEVVGLLQGGVVQMEAEGRFKKYSAPVAGVPAELKKFTVDIYTAHMDTASNILGYVKLGLPNGKGKPVELPFSDGAFFAPTYTITTRPSTGQPPYTLEYVDTLPII